jgi:hypothetical protein
MILYFKISLYKKKFDKNGHLLDSWGTVGSQDGQFLHAHGITIDSRGNVYVSDAEICNIQKFDKNGNFLTMWGSLGYKDDQFYLLIYLFKLIKRFQ